jgi:GAF domain-containing protein
MAERIHLVPDDASVRDLRRSQLEAMLSVSGIGAGESLDETLGRIARAAAGVVDARSAAILLVGPGRQLLLADAWGLSDSYRREMQERLVRGVGPSGLAVSERRSIVVPDIVTYPGLRMWREPAIREGYRSFVATPLRIEGETVGVLNVYRSEAGPWPDHDLDVLAFFADHAVTAIRIANLVDRQDRQLQALERVVRGLREQTHEHANRLHGVSGLLALGEPAEAQRFIADLLATHGQSYHAVVSGIEHATLAGLIMAETMIAGQRGITVKIDRRSRVTALPAHLGDAELIAVVGHLLEQALEVLVKVPARRRRATFSVWGSRDGAVFKVRDWGTDRLPTLNYSLLVDAVGAVDGSVEVIHHAVGATTAVTIPVRSVPRPSRTTVRSAG